MALLAVPLVVVVVLLIVLGGAVAGAQPLPPGCGAGGTATAVGDLTLDAEQMANTQIIVATTAGRGLPAYAAVVAVAASYTEAKLRNDLVQQDFDSAGLFQIRVGLHGKDVAEDPVRSTGWFLDALVQVPDWQRIPLTEAAAQVERPAEQYRDRYAAAQPLAAVVVGLLWPAARTAAPVTTAVLDDTDPDAAEPTGFCPAGGGLAGGQPTDTIACATTAAGAGEVLTGPGGVPIRVCAAGPFVVDTTIAGQVTAMLAAAAASGLDLGGTGHRSNARQIELRRAHCGPTTYDLYQRPAGECSPPTARPGQSMHEWGLALDITSAGRLIRSRNDPAWQWLAANAATYGLINLPSEPWHWSTNGK